MSPVECVRGGLSALVLASGFLLGGCAANPWKLAYVAEDASQAYAPVERVEIEYVDAFESLAPEAAQPATVDGAVRIGHGSFTGVFHGSSEDELRLFARSIGADRVRWSLKFLHLESDTRIASVSDSHTVQHRYRDGDGERRTEYDVVTTTSHYPVTEERAYYVFRAVFFRGAPPAAPE